MTITPRTYKLWRYDRQHTDNTPLTDAILPDGSRVFKLYYHVTYAPLLEVRDTTITVDDSLDLMSLVERATDNEDGDLMSDVVINDR